MPVHSVPQLNHRPEPGAELVYFSPDQMRARKLAARLESLATVHWQSMRDALAALPLPSQLPARQTVLLDFAPDAAADAAELARRLAMHAPTLPLVGVGATGGTAAGVLAALRAGVRDFLDPDAPDDEIRQLLERVRDAGSAATGRQQEPSARGRMVLLLGVRAGVGTSTLAAHLGALAMSGAAGAQPSGLLLDLGNPVGDAALYLGVESEFHYADALRGAHRIDATLIRTALGHHASRLAVLSQVAGEPPSPDLDDVCGERGDSLRELVDRLRGQFDFLLCDLGGVPVERIPRLLLREASEIWLVADQGIGTMISLDAALRGLAQRGARDHRVALLVNRYDERCGMQAEQIAHRFGVPLLATLPERSRALRSGASQGLLLLDAAPHDPYLRQLDPLLNRLQVGAHAAGANRRPHWFGRLGGFRWKNK